MNWAQAFARQACSDFQVRDELLRLGLPPCHQLHYLQMAMEKVAKAHYMQRGDDPVSLQRSHGYIAKATAVIVKSELSKTGESKPRWLMEAINRLAQQIDRLAPAVDAGGAAPSNCEYRWINARGDVVVPAEHDFRLDLGEAPARAMLKAVQARALDLAKA